MSKEYVAKESTSQEILAKVKPNLLKVEIYIGNFVADEMTLVRGRLVPSERRIYGS